MPLDAFTRATRPESYNPETRTFSAVIATPSPVIRKDARGEFKEVLDVATLRVAALPLPLLDSHRTASVRDLLGEATAIRVDGDRVVADLRLSSAEDVGPVAQRIADGSLTGLSIGYRVSGWRETTGPEGRTKTPTAWTITEVTLTSSPADPAARIRSTEAPTAPARVGGIPDNRADKPKGGTMTTTTAAPEDAERTRRAEIRTLVRSAGLGAELADDLIDQGADLTAAKAAVFDATRSRTTPVIRTTAPANGDPALVRSRRTKALAHRAGALKGDLPEEAREFAHASLLDHARACLEASGVSTRTLSADETFHRAAHSTSDFPVILQDVAHMSAMQAFTYAASPLMQVSRAMTVSDFRAHKLVRLGEVGALQEVAENGEIKAVTRAETGEEISVATYAARLDASRQLLINDSLGLFGDLAAELGQAAAAKQADLMHATLTSNPTLRDGTAVFAAGRSNLVTDDLDDAALAAARKWFRTMKGLDGKTFISAAPRFLVVGPDVEQDAEKLLASIAAATVDTVNIWTDAFTLLVEPRLTGDQWFMFADPAQVAVLRHAYLSSAQGPQVQRQEAWDTLGVSFRVFMDFGTAWTDWRAFKSTGAEA